MYSIRARPTPPLGSSARAKAVSGLPTFRNSGTRGFGSRSGSIVCRSKAMRPAYTRPSSPSAQETVTSRPVSSACVPVPVPTTHGMSSSRETIAA